MFFTKFINLSKDLFNKFPLYFIILVTIIIIQGILNGFLVFTIAPLVDFLLDNTEGSQSFVTDYYLQVLNFFNINFKFVYLILIFGLTTFSISMLNILITY